MNNVKNFSDVLRERPSFKRLITNILDFADEAEGVDTSTLPDNERFSRSHVANNRKLCEALMTLPNFEASLFDLLEEQENENCDTIVREFFHVIGQLAAWSVGDKTRIPFLQNESLNFRLRVSFGTQEAGVEAKLGPGRMEIFLPKDIHNASLSSTFEQVTGMCRYAVLASFMMHDEMISSAADKYDSAGLTVASILFCKHALNHATGNTKYTNPDDYFRYGETGIKMFPNASAAVEMGHNETFKTAFGSASAGKVGVKFEEYLLKAEEIISEFAQSQIQQNTSIAKAANTLFFNSVSKTQIGNPQFDAYDCDVSNVVISSLAYAGKAYGSILRAIDEINKQDGESGENAPDPTQKILNFVASNQGEGEPGEGEPGEGEPGEGEPGDPTTEDRKRMIARYGASSEARRLFHILGVEEEKATAEESPVDWADYIHGALMKSMGEDRQSTWTRPNRRFIGMDLYIPGFRRKRVKRIALHIDESGSIDMDKLRLFNEEIIRVIDKLNPEGVDVFHFSTQVAQEELTQGEAWEAKRLLDGGTNFRASFDAMAGRMNEGRKYDAVLFFTDLEDCGYYGIKKQNMMKHISEEIDWYWVTWGRYGNSVKPDFGTLINMDSNEIEEFDT